MVERINMKMEVIRNTVSTIASTCDIEEKVVVDPFDPRFLHQLSMFCGITFSQFCTFAGEDESGSSNSFHKQNLRLPNRFPSKQLICKQRILYNTLLQLKRNTKSIHFSEKVMQNNLLNQTAHHSTLKSNENKI